MDKREMLDRLAANGDERLLLGRVWDKYEQCRRRNLPEGTGFLSPAEQAAAQRLLNALSVTEATPSGAGTTAPSGGSCGSCRSGRRPRRRTPSGWSGPRFTRRTP